MYTALFLGLNHSKRPQHATLGLTASSSQWGSQLKSVGTLIFGTKNKCIYVSTLILDAYFFEAFFKGDLHPMIGYFSEVYLTYADVFFILNFFSIECFNVVSLPKICCIATMQVIVAIFFRASKGLLQSITV